MAKYHILVHNPQLGGDQQHPIRDINRTPQVNDQAKVVNKLTYETSAMIPVKIDEPSPRRSSFYHLLLP
ncbi:hypothetical protein CR513_43811, partial [Mucuna pruriens]